MRCRSIGCSGFVHSVHQSDQSFSGNRSGCLCKHATANLRAKLKSPKLSSWEDSSPSRSAANNQKCSESSSRSLSPCPLSYSNPCITSVYASHLLVLHYSVYSLNARKFNSFHSIISECVQSNGANRASITHLLGLQGLQMMTFKLVPLVTGIPFSQRLEKSFAKLRSSFTPSHVLKSQAIL